MKDMLSFVTDFYEFTMSNGYFCKNMQSTIAYFDVFFRKIPDNGGYAIVAGLEQIIDYITHLQFNKEEIHYLRKQKLFSEEFLQYLENFHFSGSIWAIPEGTVVFPNEPLLTVKAPIIEAQLLETMLLLTLNHQSLIATKTSRIVKAAKGIPVMEFGARRAHGVDAAVYGARASIIGGAVGTSCTLSAKNFHVPASGTMAHSWIQSFPSEYDAIKVFHEVLDPLGIRPKAVRLDSGDLAYLSKKVRKMLDENGYPDCGICATNSLDEFLIASLLEQDAKIDSFGVGENLITAKSNPVFGGVYKLSALEQEGKLIPKIKISETVAKITNPSFKKVYRFYDKDTHKALADVITLYDETLPENQYVIFDEQNPWKKKVLNNYIAVCLQKPIFENGKLVYASPDLQQIASYCKEQLESMWEEVKRLENPHLYYVDLSEKLWHLKKDMLTKTVIH